MVMEDTTKISLQDTVLDILCKGRIPLFIYLANGIRLAGYIQAFDAQIILLMNSDNILQTVYKETISTILPSQSVNLPFNKHVPQVTIKKRLPSRLKPATNAEI